MRFKYLLTCFGPLLRYIANPLDTKDEQLRKNLLVPVACIGVLFQLLFVLSAMIRDAPGAIVLCTIEAAVCFAIIAYTLGTKRFPQHIAGIITVTFGTCVIVSDIPTYGLCDYYTGSVLIMDVLLLCNCHSHFTLYVLCLTVAVIVVSWAEQIYGTFGLYDAIPETWMGYKRPGPKHDSIAINLLIQRITVFILDFLMTRYFSKGMREQREQVERSVVMAQRIASALARFDLDKAQEMVEGAEGLPLELLDALSCLLGNLRSYKPYLPQSCLPGEVESSTDAESPDGLATTTGYTDNAPTFAVTSLESASSAGSNSIVPLHIKKTVSLVQSNIRNFMCAVDNAGELTDYHSRYISCIVATAKANRGLVEHFLFDRVLISFNAAKPCASHKMQALQFASDLKLMEILPDTSLHQAVSSGEVLSGPLGCDGLRSYSLVGMVATWVPLLERVASQLSVTVITDTSIYANTKESSYFRLLGKARFVKRGSFISDLELFEFMGAKSVETEEWMYQLAREDPWEGYNKARRLFLDGDAQQAQVEAKRLSVHCPHSAELFKEVEEAMNTEMPAQRIWIVKDAGVQDEFDPALARPSVASDSR